MYYLHDIWVNWFEGEECGLNVCNFHEWRKSDPIELLEQVPVLKLREDLYLSIENGMSELPDQLLKDIFQQTHFRKNNERKFIDYCTIVTNGNGIMAFDTLGYTIPIRKSRLVPRHEQQVLDLVSKAETMDYDFQIVIDPEDEPVEINALAPHPSTLQGLTRKERRLKKLLLLALEHIYLSKNVSEVRYWFTEWFPDMYSEVMKMDFDEIWERFYQSIARGWSVQHLLICKKLIKGQNYLEELWEIEIGEHPSLQ